MVRLVLKRLIRKMKFVVVSVVELDRFRLLV